MSFGLDGALPTEFRLFTAGWNDTENGRFLFDEAAAKSTIAAFEKWGVDLMIDLEHQALTSSPPPEPNARDARGWCRLELRPDGSLWAVNVTWTPDGAQRLTEKRQRYVSPAFTVDETSRVTSIINVAIVAIPATHDTPALVAASVMALGGTTMLDAETVKKALDALESGDTEAAASILKDLIASAASGEPPPAEPDPVEETAVDPAAEPEKKEEVVAASARLMRLTGAASFVDAVAQVETFRTSHLELETERQKLSAERATLEAAERRKLCVELVTMGAEFPATVWADDKATSLKNRWLEMPLEALRTHTAEQRSARGGAKSPSAPRPPALPAGVGGELSPRELKLCADKKIDPAKYAAIKNGKT